ncbi:hypothetical protein FH972_020836 [Carpinus fangiana]|uniref:Formin-like protein n=1 Tax=Carpinus fangiana TaxID=176857 RepID=A0A5N6RXM7_9ROSI|nr:hypothetical protein FH972_020836 [Carpinus fangiana]
MALLRKFFFRKPPDGLLEICDRVYVFDSCFTTEGWHKENYKEYIGGIVDQLRHHLSDPLLLVFNFREGETQSEIANILAEYDMTIMDYPRQFESCPVLTIEVIHHFLKSSESWLSLGQHNALLMHCERGGWPVLAFMLAALLIYRKQYSGEQKTLDMVYRQAPHELFHLLSPLNPMPSQLRYLQYVARRNLASEWPPLDRALTLDCVILRFIPNFDGQGGCRPIFRVYGQDPFLVANKNPKVLYSTPKRSKTVRAYKQEESELAKIDINCHIQGDVVVECVSLNDDMEREEMMFRVMFNTAFIRSNILILNRDEIDMMWNAKDQFPKDFSAEILFSEMDAAASVVADDTSCFEEEGLPVEAFAKVQEFFSCVDWLDPKTDAALNVLQQMSASNIIHEMLDNSCNESVEILLQKTSPGKLRQKKKPAVLENEAKSSLSSSLEIQSIPSPKRSPGTYLSRKVAEPHETQIEFQLPSQSDIVCQGMPQSSESLTISSKSVNDAPVVQTPGIECRLHDHALSESITHPVAASPAIPDPTLAVLREPESPDTKKPTHSSLTNEIYRNQSSMVSPLAAPGTPFSSTNSNTVRAGAPPPPPPPHSGQTAGHIYSSTNSSLNSPSAPNLPIRARHPPPPPPPHSGQVAGPRVPSSVPPPPPGSLSLGSSGNSLSGSGKGRILSRTITSKNHHNKKLKPLHWLKLTRAVSGSLWAEAQKYGEAAKAPEIDMSELENLFSAALPSSDHGRKSMRGSVGPKSDKVQLIDHRRAYNCEIMLSKVKVSLHDLMNSVLALEDSALDVDQVENLIKFCPTKEEMELLKGYTGEKEKLGKCEQFFLELMQVPRAECKLRVFSFKIQFHSQVRMSSGSSCSLKVLNSVKLKRIMQTILSLGNALNQGTARGSAIGFRLDSLLKLTETRGRSNKMTLMHYLCKVLVDKLPEVLDFSKDLASLEPASKIQLKFLAEEMQAISKGLEQVIQELSTSENDGPVSEKFRKTSKEFLLYSEAEVRSLASLYSGVGRNVDALILYLGEDPSRCPFEQVISTLLNFMRMFNKSHEENCRQLELEMKKALESEKLQKDATHNESKQILHTPIHSGNGLRMIQYAADCKVEFFHLEYSYRVRDGGVCMILFFTGQPVSIYSKNSSPL